MLVLAFTLAISACNKDDNKTPIADVDCTTVTFSGTMSNLITTNCGDSGCHGAGSTNGEFNTYEKIKVIADNGKLANRVLDRQDMPLGGSLTSNELGQIQCWLDAGAPDN